VVRWQKSSNVAAAPAAAGITAAAYRCTRINARQQQQLHTANVGVRAASKGQTPLLPPANTPNEPTVHSQRRFNVPTKQRSNVAQQRRQRFKRTKQRRTTSPQINQPRNDNVNVSTTPPNPTKSKHQLNQ
jgi:hypothetical protein